MRPHFRSAVGAIRTTQRNYPMTITETTTPLDQLNQLIAGIPIAMITSTDTDGHLYSRPLAVQDEESDGQLWFVVSKNSPVAAEIATHPAVNLSYVDLQARRYVSVSGSARLVDDHAKLKAVWRATLANWFPRGLDTPDLALLRVQISHADYWQAPQPSTAGVVVITRIALVSTAPRAAAVHGSMDIGR
jgi:general stress protein 26